MDWEQLERALKRSMGAFVGGFLAAGLYRAADYHRHREEFSAPLWAQLLPEAAALAVIIALLALGVALVRRKRRKTEGGK